MEGSLWGEGCGFRVTGSCPDELQLKFKLGKRSSNTRDLPRAKMLLLPVLALLVTTSSALTNATRKSLPAHYGEEGAVALDGSFYIYYVHPGAERTKFVIFQKGGGWCFSDAECAERAGTGLGSNSSAFHPAEITFESFVDTTHFDILFENETASPLTWNWTKLYLPYLDGGSQVGNLASPLSVPNTLGTANTTVFYRGALIHRATVETFLASEGLSSATDVVLSGGSAGALSTFLHADSWRDALPAGAKMVALPDSGFFLNFNASSEGGHATGAEDYGAGMRWVYNRMNGTGGVPRRCAAANAADPALCIFAEVVSQTMVTPVLAQQSTYDAFQVSAILQQPASNVSAINAYGALVAARVTADFINANPNHGVFLDSCFHHVGEWNEITIDGQTVSRALAEFYAGFARPGAKRVWSQGKPYPCDACCKNGQ